MGNKIAKLKAKTNLKKESKEANASGSKDDDEPRTPTKDRPLPRVPKKTKVRALYDFDAINDDDLTFKKGDILELDESSPETEDWWLAIHSVTREKGYIPSNYVTKDDSSFQAQDWWFDFDRKDTDKMLLHAGNSRGTFLVRNSSDKQNPVLSIRDDSNDEPCVKHYKIRLLDGGTGYYISGKSTFPSMSQLIEFYKVNGGGLCCRLTTVCPRTRPAVAFRDLEIKRDQIKLTTKLGAGCFGEVWKGTLRKVVQVAVKTLKAGTMSSEAFLNEAKIMHKLTHPKLVQLMAVVSLDEPFYIITELMANGALLDFLKSEQGKTLSFPNLVNIDAQIAEGMQYLERQLFVHRDLRAANILVGDSLDVKVADFGLARILHGGGEDDNDIYLAGENAKFPVKWTAPEAAEYRKFSVKSDVWSFGVLLYEVITYGRTPYPGMSGREVLEMVASGGRMSKPTRGPIEVPDPYYDIMLECWHQEPEERPTFERLHDIFEDFAVNTEQSYRAPN